MSTSRIRFAIGRKSPMPLDESFKNRRTFLRRTLGVVPGMVLLSSGGAELLSSATALGATVKPPPATPYVPTFFNTAAWAFLNAAVDRLIPADLEGPGGVELGVPEFIDRQMETGYGYGEFWYLSSPFVPDVDPSLGYQLQYAPREFYRTAIADIDAACTSAHGTIFSALEPATQDAVLTALQKGALPLARIAKPAEFFIQLLANTKEGYFADPMYGGNRHMGSWKMIGFPGARADFKSWMTRPGVVYPLGPVSILGEKA